MRKSIESVVRGEIIVEGRKEIKVDKVEPRACSSLGTHINRSMCYDRGSIVRTKDNADPAEAGLGDLPEDYDKMWEQFEKETLEEILKGLKQDSQSRLY
jgi:hypothetical protein